MSMKEELQTPDFADLGEELAWMDGHQDELWAFAYSELALQLREAGTEVPGFETVDEAHDWFESHWDAVRRLPPHPDDPRRARTDVSLRVLNEDLEAAQRQSAGRGMEYHDYLNLLIHEALQREEKRG